MFLLRWSFQVLKEDAQVGSVRAIRHSLQQYLIAIRLSLIPIENVNQVTLSHFLNMTLLYEILRNSRKKFRLPVAAAENSWMANKITGLGQGIKIPKAYVESNLGLRQQYQTRAKWTQQVSFRTAFHKQKQNMCPDPVENARTVRDHFQRVCNIKNELDPEAL